MTDQRSTNYIALPRSASGSGVLVLHAWWGLNAFIKGFCDRLAQDGFVVLAPDMFGGKLARTPEEAQLLVNELDEERTVPPVVLAAFEELKNLSAFNGQGIGVVGFSFGAYWALWLAQEKPEAIRAVSLFYGTNGGDGDFRPSLAAFQGHFAADDPFEPEESVRAMEKALRSANRPVDFYTYPGTGHWFFEQDRADAYDEHAAELAWQRTTAFLREHLDEGG